MGNDDEEELPPFRWNWQAKVMVAFTALALVIPVGGVVWLLRGYVDSVARPASRSSPQPENPALRAALEKAAGNALSATSLDSSATQTVRVGVAAADRDGKAAALKSAVAEVNGTILEMEPGRRFLVQTPAGGCVQVCRALGLTEILKGAKSAGRDFFEVQFTDPAP